ncbi:COPII coat assembly protein SEC16 [Phlyctema vagabunda]|uniref:Protein transport protein sec16 n=1 Tax=Phlyctema vagabunda TaxID=108571 RepID=A0ABR4PHE3_9HELO
MNQSMPMIVRSPGEVKMKNIKEVSPLEENLSKFPGPLKGKAKKKELLAWLSSGIANLEQNNNQSAWHSIQPHNDKRTEERILLWKVLHAFIEHDGILEGTPVVDNAVRAILSPGLGDDASQAAPMYSTGADLSGISASTSVYPRADTVDPAAVDQLRKHLLRGEREKAVWEAVDKRLWAHAMLISNTVSRDLYRQVAQEFVQKEVKIVGENTESLAALYEIFAGNYEESIDELVPPSARAGFQMVSTSAGSGPSKDALAGLDRWRETLSLVLSNRSTDDGQALNALGKLLSSYGRAEAAHICFLFARSYSVFGGIDDPLSSIVLVGSDHQQQPYGIGKELEPILLSEVYEYGLTLSSASVSSLSMPHLAVYKLQHATMLAEFGYRDRALQYCEAIASSITSQTKRSPYHHALLVAALDDLSKRLKQSPKDESSSWISKPSIDKVSGSVWAKFSNFVAGDENDATTNGTSSGGAEIGPFARIAGGTPTISRSPSVTDLNGTYGSGVGMISPNGAMAIPQNRGSRYAPGAGYTPAHDSQLGSSYGSQPRSSLEQRSSGELKRPYAPLSRQPSDYMPMSQPGSQSSSYVPQSNMSFTPQPIYGSYGGGDSPYAQYAENASPYVSQSPGTPVTDHPAPSNVYDSPQSFANSDLQPTNSYNPGSSFESRGSSSSFEPPPTTSGYDPSSSNSYEAQSSGGYEPPSGSGYEPPSYTPAAMNDEPDSPIDTKPKKKNFMDDDDDDYNPGPKASGEKTKAEKDREADEAFKKAAEADAQRAKEAASAPKKGWGLGGWFGGGKKEAAPEASQPGKPIRAKLGEASSFVYDPDLKRWVNKKGGGDAVPTPSATPPPPRAAGPPRTASGPAGMVTSVPRPPSAPGVPPPMRSSQSLSNMNQIVSQTEPGPPGPSNLAAPPALNRTVSNGSITMAPPSRPGTSMSNASSIDDLLGPPTGARKGAAKGKKKGRGYIDVMGEKK